MSKKRRSAHNPYSSLRALPDQPTSSASPPASQTTPLTPTEALERGLREFRAKRYPQAIALWRQIEQPSTGLNAALAEAHFRLGIGLATTTRSQSEGVLTHLQYATELAPADPIYAYHFGLALHRIGRVSEAVGQYRRAVSQGLVRKGSG